MSNLDLNAAKRIIYMLSNFYPERMGQCLIVSAPMVFSAVWAVIRPWLSRRTQTKVQFCKAEELGRWIAPAALPSFWGGLDQTIYSSRSLSPSAPPPVLLCAVALSLALQHVTLSLVALALAHMCALGFGRALAMHYVRSGSPPLLSFPLQLVSGLSDGVWPICAALLPSVAALSSLSLSLVCVWWVGVLGCVRSWEGKQGFGRRGSTKGIVNGQARVAAHTEGIVTIVKGFKV